ncbi:cubilin-like [Glandiceps talaboti]
MNIFTIYYQCSVTCGGGTQSRALACYDSQIVNIVSDDVCTTNIGARPTVETQACNTQACEAAAYEYTVGTWGQCSLSCGDGVQSRSVSCNSLSTTFVVDESNCVSEGLTRPSTTQACNLGVCPLVPTYEYYTGPYGTCSVTCGSGVESRDVYCREVGTTTEVAEAQCITQGLTKPTSVQACTLSACPSAVYEYYAGPFGTCSVTCGGGYQTRTVYCREVGIDIALTDAPCEAQSLTKPDVIGSCTEQSCITSTYEFSTGEWGSCLTPCGDGIRIRDVSCTVIGSDPPEIVPDALCIQDGLTRPDEVQDCVIENCVYEFYTGEWQACSTTCDEGIQFRTVYCQQVGTSTEVADESCTNQGLEKPGTVQACTVQACPTVTYEFYTGSWSTCSTTCDEGIQLRTVYCRQVGTNTEVADVSCTNQGLEKPGTVQACTVQACPTVTYEFYTGSWSTCTVTCGGGTQTRDVNCAVVGTNGGSVVSDATCILAGLNKPAVSQTCNTNDCTGNYIYVTGQWSACSTTCGAGTQTRNIICFDTSNGNSAIVDDAFCVNAGVSKPAEVQSCPNPPTCPTITYEFYTGPYETCTVTCGGGVQTRLVYCRAVGTTTELDDSVCIGQGLVKPTESQVCNTNSCSVTTDLLFIPGPWGQCSATCGSGTQTRSLTCIDTSLSTIVDNSNCVNAGLTVPATTQACPNLDACPVYQYSTGAWETCTTTCGSGTQTRSITCIDTTTSITVAMSVCENLGLTLPATTQACPGLPICPVYAYAEGPWSFCSVTCDGGQQSRTVECIETTANNAVVDDSNCVDAQLTKPSEQQTCNTESCAGGDVFIYITSAFSDCDCNTNTQTRAVQCVQLTATSVQVANDAQCQLLNQVRPDATQSCVPPPNTCIYSWNATDWTPCSVTCGIGERTRYVYCESEIDNSIVSDNLCPVNRIPERETCDTQVHCPKDYYWLEGDWSECSETCGIGVETRTAECYTLNGVIHKVEDSFCSNEELPQIVRACNLRPCQGIWVSTHYSECTVTCGTGIQTRQIDCRLAKDANETVAEDDCVQTKPPTERDCVKDPCPKPFGCDATYYTEEGILTSPNFPNKYPVDLDCQKTVISGPTLIAFLSQDTDYRPDQHIEITFTQFNLEESEDCAYDFVEINDHYGVKRTKLCGELDELPFTYKAVGDSVDVIFYSDTTENDQGYAATWEFVPNDRPYYTAGEWSECSAVCDNGIQRREVTCMQEEERVAARDCEEIQLIRPVDSRPCENLPPCPQYEDVCNETLTNETSVFSPGYPANYADDTDCVTMIDSEDACVKITFDFLDVEFSPDCRMDFVDLRDNDNAAFSQRFCGSPDTLPVWHSSSGDVTVTFHSNGQRNGQGYTASTEFVTCPQFLYSTGPWEECSEPCGGGTQTRPVLCMRVSDNNVVADNQCPGVKPEDSQPCNERPCSDCSRFITSNQVFSSPNYPQPYNDNDLCSVVVSNTNRDECVRLTFLAFDVQDGEQPGDCDRDSVKIEDIGNSALTVEYCGRQTPPAFISSSSDVMLEFETDRQGVGIGYEVDVRFEACPPFAYQADDWSECDVTCGGGTRTRSVTCVNVGNGQVGALDECVGVRPRDREPCNEEPCRLPRCDERITTPNQFINSPNFPQDYNTNQTCTIEIVNPDGCIRLVEIDFEVEPGNGTVCDNDYLEVEDGEYEDHGGEFCGSDGFSSWTSYSGSVELTFESNDEVAHKGYSIFETFVACPEGEFDVGQWSRCSERCGGGETTRSVLCKDGNDVLPDELCPGVKPPTTEACNEFPCDTECDLNVTSVEVVHYTADDYHNSSDCRITVTNDAGCVGLVFIRLDIEPGTTSQICDNDYLEIDDPERSGPAPRFCGTNNPPQLQSVGSTFVLTFHTNDDDTRSGFQFVPQFNQCPTFNWDIGAWGGCDVTCGGGQRTRSVSCINSLTNAADDESLCPLPKPAESESCSSNPCPGCDRNVTTAELIQLTSAEYENNLDCKITVTNDNGCMNLIFISLGIEAGSRQGVCDNDYLEVDDQGAGGQPPRFCGSQTPPQLQSVSGTVVLTVHTNSAVTGSGFQVFPQFNQCPQYSWNIGDWEQCDANCGGGTRTRTVTCTETGTTTLADESLCAGQKPAELENCNEQPCPGCDRNVTTSEMIQFTSADYENDLDCEITISNSAGCMQLIFITMDIEAGSSLNVCDNDYLEVDDLGRNGQPPRFCGSRVPPQYQSVSGTVVLTVHTNNAVTGSGFQVFPQFNQCPQYSWNIGDWEQCDVTCGGGTRTRTVTCTETGTTTLADESLCAGQKPAESENCNEQPCPGCDRNVTTSEMIQFTSADYENDLDCEITISNSAGCMQLIFIAMDIEAGSSLNVCDNDYLEVDDLGRAGQPPRFCGSQTPPQWQSVSGTVVLTVHTNNAVTGSGFQVFPQFNQCPQYSWNVDDWEQCDVTCGGGTRTRTVTCTETGTTTLADESLCAGQKPAESENCNEQPCPGCDRNVTSGELFTFTSADYENDLDCEITITNDNGCMSLVFINMDIEAGSTQGVCDNDYLEINDLGSTNPPRRFCGSQTPPTLSSVSGTVVLTVHTNSAVTGNGFQVFPQNIPCPQYSWDADEWSDCDVTCGGGTRTRNVTCTEIGTGQLEDDSLCTGQKPAEIENCNTDVCPSCDGTITTQQFINSPNYDQNGNYDNNQDCTTTINAPGGLCTRLTFVNFVLQPGSTAGLCDTDYVEITDLGYPTLTDKMCGGISRVFNSRSSNVEVVFHSDDSVTARGFSVYATFVTCPTYSYLPGAWGECDVTCGGGQRTRTVVCQQTSDNSVVNDINCNQLAVLPTTEPCNLEACPVCDASFSTSGQFIQSTNYPQAYPANQDCTYDITNGNGCVSVTFLAFNLEDSVDCTKDYLEIQDTSYPDLTRKVCGVAIPQPWVSSSGSVDINFHSDGDNEGTGFFIQETFVSCPVYDWITGAWGQCSVTCDNGVEIRTVECRNTQTNAGAPAESLCVNTKPDETQPCSRTACEIDCDATLTSASALQSYNYPSNYVDGLDCVTTVTNGVGCINVIFTAFDVEAGSTSGLCDNDYVLIEDTVYGISERYCGTYSTLPTFQSASGSVRVTFHSNDNSVTSTGYQAFATFNTCPQFAWSPGAWSSCSVTCDGGVQTRTVQCLNSQSSEVAPTESLCAGTKPPVSQVCNTQTCLCGQTLTNVNGAGLQSPDYGSAYDNDLDCVNTVLNTAGECVRIIFINLDLEEGSTQGVCDKDYIEISDTNGNTPAATYCGSTTPTQPWESTGSTVSIRFVSDNSGSGTGYYLFYSFFTCPDYTWQTTVWAACSQTCGGGVQTRTVTCRDGSGNPVSDSLCNAGSQPVSSQACNTNACPTRYQWQTVVTVQCPVTCGGGTETLLVYCQDLLSSNTVDDSLCTEQKPSDTRACNTDACPSDGVPACGSTVQATSTTGTIQSPQYPSSYPNDQDCLISFNLPANTRIKFTITAFSLEEDTSIRCEKDYLKFESLPSGNAALYCKDYLLPLIWESSAGDTSVSVQFYSDASGTESGYTATWEHI